MKKKALDTFFKVDIFSPDVTYRFLSGTIHSTVQLLIRDYEY